jgi:hypothetical protein
MSGLVKHYRIGGRVYEQRPLVLAQFGQLCGVLQGASLPTSAADVGGLLAMGDQLVLALAVVLRPKRPWPISLLYTPQRKNLSKLATHLALHIDAATVQEVAQDFFTCNPVASISRQIQQVTGKEAGLKTSSSCSVTAIPATESGSCGPSRCETSAPGTTTAAVN